MTDSEQCMTCNGWMTGDSFLQWSKFFIDQIKDIRGSNNLWVLLILDMHTSHTLCPEALSFMLNHNVVVLGLPSHSTSYLQPLDIGIFHPLKQYFKNSQDTFQKKNGLLTKLDDFTKIAANPWEQAHSASNIKNSFQKSGIWPLDVQWTSHNAHVFNLIGQQEASVSREEKFTKLVNKVKKEDMERIIKDLEYLDLAKKDSKVTQKPNYEEILDQIYLRCLNHNQQMINPKKEKINSIGENPSTSKILNDDERITKLIDVATNKRKKKTKRDEFEEGNDARSVE